jgi:hypothetical protein
MFKQFKIYALFTVDKRTKAIVWEHFDIRVVAVFVFLSLIRTVFLINQAHTVTQSTTCYIIHMGVVLFYYRRLTYSPCVTDHIGYKYGSPTAAKFVKNDILGSHGDKCQDYGRPGSDAV